ncbi:hypothetical protein EJ04DRAFT_113641 [Polyplosphaeria fusca]|uniref:Uncharacterized protein n=1 Tax=Polyplosphaeria fusca TaxID=682080 RepID=A0A9P4V5W0_9PLEO|nr:hypothetical protein EJ04DRAFT_113641 [Polyplosphaeria fusca]
MAAVVAPLCCPPVQLRRAVRRHRAAVKHVPLCPWQLEPHQTLAGPVTGKKQPRRCEALPPARWSVDGGAMADMGNMGNMGDVRTPSHLARRVGECHYSCCQPCRCPLYRSAPGAFWHVAFIQILRRPPVLRSPRRSRRRWFPSPMASPPSVDNLHYAHTHVRSAGERLPQVARRLAARGAGLNYAERLR